MIDSGQGTSGSDQVADEVRFWRSPDVRGVEIRSVRHSSRQWRCFSAGFEFLAPQSWRGEIISRRHRASVAPGTLFCSHPDEVYSTRRVFERGSFDTLVIDPDVFWELVAAHGYAKSAVQLRRVAPMSGVLSGRLADVFTVLTSDAAVVDKRAALLAFVRVVLAECLIRSTDRQRSPVQSDGTADLVHRCLNADVSVPTDLHTLSREVGLSRFQVLRAFRRSYGLPPHAYQLCVRIGLAQKALRHGAALAEVAADLGFVDQSHFSRHFKRFVGVTPFEYASARTRRSRPRARGALHARNADSSRSVA